MNKLLHPHPPSPDLRDARAMLSRSCLLIDSLKGDAYDISDFHLIKDSFRQRGIISNTATILCGSGQAGVLYRIISEFYEDSPGLVIESDPWILEFEQTGIRFVLIEVCDLPEWRMIIVPEPIF